MSDDERPPKYFDFEERQKQKARSRERDEERLARGEVTPSELQRENSAFSHIKFTYVLFRRKSGRTYKMKLDRKPRKTGDSED